MGKTPAPVGWPSMTCRQCYTHSGVPHGEHARGLSGTALVRPTRTRVYSVPAFMEKVLNHVDRQSLSPEIVRKDRPAASLEAVAERNQTRDAAIQEAYSTGACTITQRLNYLPFIARVATPGRHLDKASNSMGGSSNAVVQWVPVLIGSTTQLHRNALDRE